MYIYIMRSKAITEINNVPMVVGSLKAMNYYNGDEFTSIHRWIPWKSLFELVNDSKFK